MGETLILLGSFFHYKPSYSEANDSSGLQGLRKLMYVDFSNSNVQVSDVPVSVSKLVSLEV